MPGPPDSTRGLDSLPQVGLAIRDRHTDHVGGLAPPRASTWRPGDGLDDQLHGLVALRALRIVAIADAHQPLAVLGEELFRSVLSGGEAEARFRGHVLD